MYRQGIGSFKYYVGISSLDQIATREDRVCVLNILGGESSDVTPVGHVYSGGNVVFGTSPGRSGQVLETSLGNIPVYNNVREGLEAGHRFNCGVIYLPPSGARDGVAELIRVNPELRKIFIVTEKLSVHDAREIRAMGQQNGIDIFGGNSLGVADSWNQVRIGGALGGDSPAEALRKGSIAIFSNSGNFTTTIATYLRMAGWGTTTLISSGKDVYIHFAAPEFAFALANDARSKAAVLYVEPGGYYELDANFTKPVVACVVGRWKTKLTRAVGHAGAMAGGNDDAARQGTLVHGQVRRRRHLHARESGLLGARCRRDQHRPYRRGADRGDARERLPAGLRARRAACRSRRGSAPTRGWSCRRSSTCRWSRRCRPTTPRSRASTSRSAPSSRASR